MRGEYSAALLVSSRSSLDGNEDDVKPPLERPMWGCLYYREEPHKARRPPPHILNAAWGALLQATPDGCLIFFPCLTVASGVIVFHPTF